MRRASRHALIGLLIGALAAAPGCGGRGATPLQVSVMWDPQVFPQWQAMQYLAALQARFGPAVALQTFYAADSLEAERQLLIAARGTPALLAYLQGRWLMAGSPWEGAVIYAGADPGAVDAALRAGRGRALFVAQAPPQELARAYAERRQPVLMAAGRMSTGPPSLEGWAEFLTAAVRTVDSTAGGEGSSGGPVAPPVIAVGGENAPPRRPTTAATDPGLKPGPQPPVVRADRRTLDRPRVPRALSVFTMAQCPFGIQAMHAVLAGMEKKDLPDVTLSVHYIVEAGTGASPSFWSMHGAAEWEEAARQKIIRKHFPDQFGKYLAVRNRTPDSSLWEDAAQAAGLAPQTIRDRFEEGKRDLRDDARLVKALGITSSPTFLWENRLVLVGLEALRSVPGFQKLPASATGGCGIQAGGPARPGGQAADWSVMEIGAAWLTSRMPEGVKTITPQELRARQLRHEAFVLVDARHRAAYEAKHIAGAVSILRWKVPNEDRLRPPWPLDTEIVVYCQRACRASARVLEELWQIGYRRLWRLPAGPEEWERLGYPTESGTFQTGTPQ